MVNLRLGISHTGMDNVHGAHCAAGVVEDPFLVLVEVGVADLFVQLGDDVLDNRASVIAVGGNCALGHIVQMVLVKDVEVLQAGVEEPVHPGHQRQSGEEETESAH